MILFSILLLLSICSQISSNPLLHEIQNTKKLIQLYQQKLKILHEMLDNQNTTIQQQNHTPIPRPSSTTLKQQKQLITQLNITFEQGARFIFPTFIINSSTIIDLKGERPLYHINGGIVAIDHYEITTKISNDKVRVVNFRDKVIQKNVNIAVSEIGGKWHKAIHFQNIFMEFHGSILTFINEKQKKKIELQSQIIDIFTINQFKILFITLHQFGYINVNSLQLSDITPLSQSTQSVSFSDGILFLLLSNGKLLVIFQQKIISQQNLQTKYIHSDTKISYLKGGNLFLYSPSSKCFDIFQTNIPKYFFTHSKQLCIQKSFNYNTNITAPFNYQFFKIGSSVKVLFGTKNTNTKIYEIPLIQNENANNGISIPWKFIMIVICVLTVIIFKLKSSPHPQKPDEFSQLLGVKQQLKKQKQNKNCGQQYITQLTNQIKMARNIDKKQI